jgi:beta-glucosidase
MKKIFFIFFIALSIQFAQKKTIEQRADSVLSLMTLEEKVGQLVQYSGVFDTGNRPERPTENRLEMIRKGKVGSFLNIIGADETKKLQKIAIEESRLKIPLIFGLDVIHGYKSTFPVPIGEASTWNTELIEKSADTRQKKHPRLEYIGHLIRW